jgi:hypothetical protein
MKYKPFMLFIVGHKPHGGIHDCVCRYETLEKAIEFARDVVWAASAHVFDLCAEKIVWSEIFAR